MIKKIALILLSAVMLLAVCGCQLAVEGQSSTDVNTDALCGMFITFEPLPSNDDYLENIDWNAVMSGDQSSLYNQGAQKIYAVPKDDGISKSYYFEGIDGLRLFSVFVPESDERNGYNTNCADDLIMDRHTFYNDTDSSVEITLEGTLYVCSKVYGGDEIFNCYSNPVYQTPEGEVYVTQGNGHCSDMWPGSSVTTTLSGTAAKIVNEDKKSRTTTVKLTLTGIDYIEKYVLKELDSEDNVVSTLEIQKDNVPEEITLTGNTAYAILEKHCTDAEDKPYIERSFIDMSLDYMGVRFINEDGFAQAYVITLKNLPAKQ